MKDIKKFNELIDGLSFRDEVQHHSDEIKQYILSLITSMSDEIQIKFKKRIEKYINNNNFMLPDSDTIELLLEEEIIKIAEKYKKLV